MAPCPRCRRENPPTAAVCAGCGTPLAFDDDPAPSPLAVELDLDRRRPGRERVESEPLRQEEVEEPSADDADADAEEREEVDADDAEEGAALGDAGEEEPGEGADPEAPVAGEAFEADLRPASPARRAAAWAIDGALVAALAVAVPALLVATSGVGGRPPLWLLLPAEGFVAVVTFVYATVAHALAGATLGKRVARIRVVGPDGAPPGIACSASRSAWAAASILLAGAGFLPALVSPSGRALHDLLAGTRVVDA
ncbi:MAG TPA: RDD family protein [Anaeromyxobacteraceae bacterium]|nr:RDD family protein [Anaeromyxobacteraceae bacterium]